MKILIVNGPNLNMLGKRDRAIYGNLTLDQLNGKVKKHILDNGASGEFFFSNCEGEIISKLQENDADAVILNAGAYSHYSYAIRDCIECMNKPVVEVHLSDIDNREDFRKKRVFDGVVERCFFGEKELSYFKAVDYLCGLEI